jgi:hypothetical protein
MTKLIVASRHSAIAPDNQLTLVFLGVIDRLLLYPVTGEVLGCLLFSVN